MRKAHTLQSDHFICKKKQFIAVNWSSEAAATGKPCKMVKNLANLLVFTLLAKRTAPGSLRSCVTSWQPGYTLSLLSTTRAAYINDQWETYFGPRIVRLLDFIVEVKWVFLLFGAFFTQAWKCIIPVRALGAENYFQLRPVYAYLVQMSFPNKNDLIKGKVTLSQ